MRPSRSHTLTDDVYGNLNGQGTASSRRLRSLAAAPTTARSPAPSPATPATTRPTPSPRRPMTTSNNEATDTDDATVSLTDVLPTINVDQDRQRRPASTSPAATSPSPSRCTNTIVETVTLTALSDDKYGDLNGQGDCASCRRLHRRQATATPARSPRAFSGNAGDDPDRTRHRHAIDDEGNTDRHRRRGRTVSLTDVQPDDQRRPRWPARSAWTSQAAAHLHGHRHQQLVESDPVTITALSDDSLRRPRRPGRLRRDDRSARVRPPATTAPSR